MFSRSEDVSIHRLMNRKPIYYVINCLYYNIKATSNKSFVGQTFFNRFAVFFLNLNILYDHRCGYQSYNLIKPFVISIYTLYSTTNTLLILITHNFDIIICLRLQVKMSGYCTILVCIQKCILKYLTEYFQHNIYLIDMQSPLQVHTKLTHYVENYFK